MKNTDENTTLSDIRKWSAKVRKDRNWNPDSKDLAISMSLEISELLEHFQWGNSKDLEKAISDNAEKKQEIALELGDVVNYLCEFADRLEIDITTALKATLDKVERKYPVKEIKEQGNDFYYKQKKKYQKVDSSN